LSIASVGTQDVRSMDGNEIALSLVAIATLVISLFTFVMASNDRRRTADRDELKQLREDCERLQRERDDLERRYYGVLEENSTLRRGNR
jgi:hypothetical protein